MGALKVILSKIFSVLLHVLGACVALYRLHFALFYPAPYLASAKFKFCYTGRTQGNVAILSFSSYFNAALCLPVLGALQTTLCLEHKAGLSYDK
jgi:hypothetical protein